MSTAEIKCTTLRLELKQRWTIAHGASDYRDNVFVELKKDGLTGYGEAALSPRYPETAATATNTINQLTALFKNANLLHYRDLGEAIQNAVPGNYAAKAALDIALLDWFCKFNELPCYQLFGLDRQSTSVTCMSIGMDSPDIIRQKVEEAQAFPVLKIKLGSDNDEEIINAVRSATDKPLRIDANEGWRSREIALKKIEWLQENGPIELIEQPMPVKMLVEMAWLKQRSKIPLIADEDVMTTADIPRLADAFHGINIKLMKAGGLQEALKMITLARAFDMKVMLGCMVESSVAISAAASISPLVDFADLDGNLLLKNDPFEGLELKDAKPVLSDLPGIGVTPRAD